MPRAKTTDETPKRPGRKREPTVPLALHFAPADFRRDLSAWYRYNARRLPWRTVRDPYATWLSEIMLQQTRVTTVLERYREFVRCFPTIQALAEAAEDDVLALWSGLGYYRRARMLHRGAQFVMRELKGKLPRHSTDLRTLPGVGDYTAAAIASIAFGESIAVIDGNVERVLLRILGLPEDRSAIARHQLATVAQSLVPPATKRKDRGNPPGDHNQAMMELGAMICTPRKPMCLQCPVMDLCLTRGEHPTGTRPVQQSRQVAHLLSVRKRGMVTEVLLERRAAQASLMPGMLELPPLPMDIVRGLEPILRVSHAITNTNYYVQVFAESAPGAPPLPGLEAHETPAVDEELFRADDEAYPGKTYPLREAVPAADETLEWAALSRLLQLPLTGLTRKILQRLGLIALPKVQLR